MRKVFTLFIFIFISFSILAPGKVIRGKVIDFDSGSPISGVSIPIIGTNQTVKTNKAVFLLSNYLTPSERFNFL